MAEAALVLPVCLLVVFGIFEYGRYFMTRNLLANAAREGARFAVVHTADMTTADVQNVVLNYLASQQSQVGNLVIQVYPTDPSGNAISGQSCNDTPFASGIGVQVDGDYYPVLATFLLMPGMTHLEAVAIMSCEGN
jgi:Flp pilus assembly protein TadG